MKLVQEVINLQIKVEYHNRLIEMLTNEEEIDSDSVDVRKKQAVDASKEKWGHLEGVSFDDVL